VTVQCVCTQSALQAGLFGAQPLHAQVRASDQLVTAVKASTDGICWKVCWMFDECGLLQRGRRAMKEWCCANQLSART
jgi:hypothetical protein